MILQKRFFYCIALLFLITTFISCDPQKRINHNFNYFQKGLDSIQSTAFLEYKFQENDLITIQVIAGSLRQEDAALYNLATGVASTAISGANSGTSTPLSNNGAGYLVNADGNIEMPKIGKIKAVGLNKKELANIIELKLADEVKNPLVIVKLSQFKVSVLGEVRKPGVVSFKTDKATILDAIAEAGDLSETGKREDVALLRLVDGKYETFKIDLRNTAFFSSPAFQMHQNDIIYVGANINKLKTLNINPNFQRDYSLAITTVSALFLVLNTIVILKGRL